MKDTNDNLVPEQNEGAYSDTVNSVSFATPQEAAQFYSIVKNRLKNINHWNRYAGEALANFTLLDIKGDKVERQPQQGDYFQIEVPGIGNPSGDGYDFVQIERIEEKENAEESVMAITVRPSSSPLNDDKNVAHFFDEKATSTFIVKLHDNAVYAEVHGRNEKPNVKEVHLSDKLRNSIVATGSVLGFSKLQWSTLTKGLVSADK